MKLSKTLIILTITTILFSMTADKSPYQIFNSKGKQKTYDKMLSELQKADIIFFGELHNNAISHWFEYELVKDLYEIKKEQLIIGAEMFESDQQLIIDEYLAGLVTKKNFEDQARLWKNHSTDYAPIIDFAKEKNIKVIATNIPRRYAALVNKSGFDALTNLTDEAKKMIAPLPIVFDPNVECYKKMQDMMQGMPGARHGTSFIAEAQASKDATMAYFILKNLKEGQTFFHFNGSYHSNNNEGIIWYIKQQKPELKILSINTLEQQNTDTISEEDCKTADFIIITDEDFTKTY